MAKSTDERLTQLSQSLDNPITTKNLDDAPTIVVRPDESVVEAPTQWDFTAGNVIDPSMPDNNSFVEDTYSPSFEIDQNVIAENQDNPVFTDDEPTQVAGIKKSLKNITLEYVDGSWRPVKKQSKGIESASKEIKTKQTKELNKRLKEVEDAVTDTYLLDEAEAGQEFVFNINKISDDVSLSAWMEANAKALKLESYNPLSYKKIAAKYNKPEYAILDGSKVVKITSSKKVADKYLEQAIKDAASSNKIPPKLTIVEQPRYSQEFIDSMLDPKFIAERGRTIANPEEVFKQFHFLTTVSKLAYQKGQDIAALINAGRTKDVTNAMRLEFQQLVALEGVLSKKLKGVQVDLARSLGILNEARKAGDVSIGRMTDEALDHFGGPSKIDRFITAYVAEKSALQRNKLAEVLTRPLYRRIIDIIPVTYINGLLSNITTDAKNLLGFLNLSTAVKLENFVAVGLGKTRTYIFRGDGEDAMKLEQAIAAIKFRSSYWKKAWGAFADSISGKPPRDGAVKFEYSGDRYADVFKYDVPVIGKPIEYLGIYSTFSGKMLQSEDEFMKALSFWHEVEIQATGIMVNKRNALVREGVKYADADTISKKLFDDIMADPPQEIVEDAIQQARYLTNTQPLTGSMRQLEKVFNNPFAKFHFLFMRVTSNLIGAASERNILTAGLTPRVWKNFQAGGAKRDIAMARMLTGSTFIGFVADGAMKGYITGAGPYRYSDRVTMEKDGWQAYSFVFDAGRLSEETIKKFSMITKVTRTKNKVFISYEGLEPISLLVAQGATIGELMRIHQSNPGEEYEAGLEEITGYALQGAYTYISDHPIMGGMGNLAKMFTSYEEGNDKFAGILENVFEDYSTYVMGGNPIGQYVTIDGKKQFVLTANSGALRAIEKVLYPERSMVKGPQEMRQKDYRTDKITEWGGEAASRGFEKSLKKLCASNPMCSESLPFEKDPITGAVKKNGLGNVLDIVSPFKPSSGKVSPAHSVIIEYGANEVNPRLDYGTYKAIELTDEQLSKITDYATRGGRLEKSIVELGKSLKNKPQLSNAQKADLINATQSAAYRAARDYVVANDRSIQRLLRSIERERRIEDRGQSSFNKLKED